jgi:hypothetical protein
MLMYTQILHAYQDSMVHGDLFRRKGIGILRTLFYTVPRFDLLLLKLLLGCSRIQKREKCKSYVQRFRAGNDRKVGRLAKKIGKF